MLPGILLSLPLILSWDLEITDTCHHFWLYKSSGDPNSDPMPPWQTPFFHQTISSTPVLWFTIRLSWVLLLHITSIFYVCGILLSATGFWHVNHAIELILITVRNILSYDRDYYVLCSLFQGSWCPPSPHTTDCRTWWFQGQFWVSISILHASSLVYVLPGGKSQAYWLYPCCRPLLLPVKEQRPCNKIPVKG